MIGDLDVDWENGALLSSGHRALLWRTGGDGGLDERTGSDGEWDVDFEELSDSRGDADGGYSINSGGNGDGPIR